MQTIIRAAIAFVMRFPGVAGGLALAFAVYSAGAFLVDLTTWNATQARVVAVSEMCHMEATVSRSRRSREVVRGTVPCDRVEAQRARQPQYDFSVTRRISATIAYAAPNGARLEAAKPLSFLGLQDGVKVGDVLTIEYRASVPSDIRPGGDLSGLVAALIGLFIGGALLWVAYARREKVRPEGGADAATGFWADRVALPRDGAHTPETVAPKAGALATPMPSPVSRVVRSSSTAQPTTPAPAPTVSGTRIVRTAQSSSRPASSSSGAVMGRPLTARNGLVSPPAPAGRDLVTTTGAPEGRTTFGRRG